MRKHIFLRNGTEVSWHAKLKGEIRKPRSSERESHITQHTVRQQKSLQTKIYPENQLVILPYCLWIELKINISSKTVDLL